MLDAVVAGEDDLADEMVVGDARRELVELVSEKEGSLGGGEARECLENGGGVVRVDFK